MLFPAAKLDTVKSVLLLSSSELVRRCGLSHNDVDSLVAAACEGVVKHSVHCCTALQLYRERQDSPNHGE